MMKSFAVIGRKGAGRSTVLLLIVTCLKKRGHRVGVVRHLTREDVEIDEPGKDTYEYRMQGAEKVILSGRKRCAVFENREEELPVEELQQQFQGYDFVFFEEYYSSALPAVEVLKQGAGDLIPEKQHTRIALCSDSTVEVAVPVFLFQEMETLADYLESFSLTKTKEVLPC